MHARLSYDAAVVGAGPNGLAAAVRLAGAGLSVVVLEGSATIGGGARSAELTLPGFTHDVCSSVHPLGIASPWFRGLPLAGHGLAWAHPPIPLAHPLDGGGVAVLERGLAETVKGLGEDGAAYGRAMGPLVRDAGRLLEDILRPPLRIPRHPLTLARFGWLARRAAADLAGAWFKEPAGRALFAGIAAHGFLPLEQGPSAACGVVLSLLAHASGWPFARGGSQRISDSLAAHFRSLGGEIATRCPVSRMDEIPLARTVVLDLTPRQLVPLGGAGWPASYRKRLEAFRYGPGVFKIDYAMDWPVPWTNAVCSRAGTVHLGGEAAEIATAEREVTAGRIPERPFVILTQPSVADPTRAPEGCSTVWAYCHVPHGSTVDMTARIEAQIERFAPGFAGRVLARHTRNCAQMEAENPNLVGGDINGGVFDWRQYLARPVATPTPYRTPVPGIYLCSASTPPGGGVHGMCGFHAAEAALRGSGYAAARKR